MRGGTPCQQYLKWAETPFAHPRLVFFLIIIADLSTNVGMRNRKSLFLSSYSEKKIKKKKVLQGSQKNIKKN